MAFVLVLGGPLGEELGWRGVLQPRLEAQLGSLRATLLTGIVWAARHLPLFALGGTVQQSVTSASGSCCCSHPTRRPRDR